MQLSHIAVPPQVLVLFQQHGLNGVPCHAESRAGPQAQRRSFADSALCPRAANRTYAPDPPARRDAPFALSNSTLVFIPAGKQSPGTSNTRGPLPAYAVPPPPQP
eukprot:EG_transcript_57718